jgi:hypothetical protein
MAGHYSSWRLAIPILSILAGGTWSAQVALGQYTWVQASAGTATWADAARWTGGTVMDPTPNGIGATVTMQNPTRTGSGVVQVTIPTTDVTVGEIHFTNAPGFANGTRTNLVGAGASGQRLIFQTNSGNAKWTEDLNTNTAAAGSQNQISVPVVLNSDLEITQNNYQNLNTGTQFNFRIDGSAARTIIKKGVGGIQFNNSSALDPGQGFFGQILLQEGSIRTINSSLTLSTVSGMTVSAGGQLQLGENTGNTVGTYSLADGVVLKINGNGTNAIGAPPLAPVGALNFGVIVADTSMTFANPVELQSDSTISVEAYVPTGGIQYGVPRTEGILSNKVFGNFGLTKHGDGKLTITNPLSGWGGDTHILTAPTDSSAPSGAGMSILSLSNPILADSRDVYLSATRSALDLNFDNTDTIRSLFVDGVAQAVGLYGAIGSPNPTDIERPWITGSGELNVTSLPVVGLAGDFNSDGKVDAGDYATWRKNESANATLPNDNGAGTQAARYSLWRSNFGSGGPGSGSSLGLASVPEPATIVLSALLVPFFATLTARRKFGRTRS